MVDMMGNGEIYTDANGDAQIKYMMPALYAVEVIPPQGETWHQTTTIDGTPYIDAWVKLNEAASMVEFGAVGKHVYFGMVNPSKLPWAVSPPVGGATITGRLVDDHFSRPPALLADFPGAPVIDGLIGLNDASAPTQGLYAASCNADGTFAISNVPPGTYELVTWDKPLDRLIGFNPVTVTSNGETVVMGDVLCLRWHAWLKGSVFYDSNANGFRDDGEPGMKNQALNIRFRDGSVQQSTATDDNGDYFFREIPVWFAWLVAEINYDRFKPTGMTAAMDNGGGPVLPGNGWVYPSFGILNPQPQFETDPVTGWALTNALGQFIPVINPNTGNNLSRTETGPVLLEAMMNFQANVIDWGKVNYGTNENGGIVGIVYYDTTRAENDPRLCAGEPWEPGIPRVQVNLYTDNNHDKIIDDLNHDGRVTLTDVDNYPFGWKDGGPKGAEDLDRNTNGVFDAGDAIQIVYTDSWDDNIPEGSIQTNPATVHGQRVKPGYDAYGTWDQVRPGVFDGGYWFNSYFPGGMDNTTNEVDGLPSGTYIVESVPPPGYVLVKEEDKNVDFGDAYTPSSLQLLPECVGDAHVVPAELSLFPGVPCVLAGQTNHLADRRLVTLNSQKNVNCDFFFFTEVPKAARAVGLVTDDLHANFDPSQPFYGEKATPSWIPISFQDFAGHEVARVYCDEFGGYNAMVPSTYSVNVPSPSGVSPMMLMIVCNDPTMPDPNHPGQRIPDPFYDPDYTTESATWDFWPGRTTYPDTPIMAQGGLVGYPNGRMDVEPTNGTPVIFSAAGPSGGPLVQTNSDVLTITAMGPTSVPNPLYSVTNGLPLEVIRDFGFGSVQGRVTVNGIPLNILSWTTNTITATAPTNVPTGQLMITRGDNGLTTRIGLTLTVGAPTGTVHHVTAQPYPAHPIQDAIDAANPGDLILVGPGAYDENVILWKPVRLQGSGAGSTIIRANPNPGDRLSAWHTKVQTILGTPGTDPFTANDAPGVMVLGDAGFPFNAVTQARIDGFYITGAKVGGGIGVYTQARYLQISNNRLKGNSGSYAGGLSVGVPGAAASSANDHVTVSYNEVLKNGSTGMAGTAGSGGVAFYVGSDDYQLTDNFIIGNLTTANGAGVSHLGLSQRGLIARNKIVFNEAIDDLTGFGFGGGLFLGGDVLDGAITPGAGTVSVIGNLIQGNISGAGHGGGIRVDGFNGQDVVNSPSNTNNWYALYIFNNIIVNNAAGYAAGGVSLQDAARCVFIHNTVANNDSCATAQAAFPQGATNSTPQPAGVVAHMHSTLLAAAFSPATGQTFANPVLYDNIIWHNRSFYINTDPNVGGEPSNAVAVAGAILPNPVLPYWDLQVWGTTNRLNPQSSILSLTNGYHSSNLSSNPLFVAAYTNLNVHATVPDEAGNQVSLRFSPINLTGNYHIQSGSPAVNRAESSFLSTYPVLHGDYDTDYRPYNTNADIGADEFSVATVFATNDSYFVTEDTLLTVVQPGVLTNDRPGALTAVLEDGPAHGTLTLSSNGRVVYRPATNFFGTDTFTYRAISGAARSRPAMVTITVRPVTDAPSAGDDSYTVNGNGSISVPAAGVLANDTDPSSLPLTAVLSLAPDFGTLSLQADGSFTYTPNAGFEGVDVFYYTANNGQSDSDPALVILNVVAPSPDFVVTAISLVPEVITNGGSFTAYVKVMNQGTSDGAGGQLSVWRDQPGPDVPTGTAGDTFATLGTIAAGTSTTVTFTALSAPAIPLSGTDQYAPTFRAFADSTGGQAEFTEVNNQLTQPYQVVKYTAPVGQNAVSNGMLVAQDMITVWNLIALEMVKTNAQMAPMASRSLAMMHGAMFDAVNSIDGSYSPYREMVRPGYACSIEAGAAAAAYAVLSGIYTGQVTYLNLALSNSLASVADGVAKTNGIALGSGIGQRMLEWRMHDHMLMMDTNYTVGANPGDWRPTPPGYMAPMMPHWGEAMPFSLTHGMQLPLPPAPPELDSDAYAAAVNEVKAVGASNSTVRTVAQTQAVMFWTDMPGTVTTAGRWNQIARDAAAMRTNSLVENARLFAMLNISLADAGIAAWNAKYTYNRWRPITAIREAATDGNPATVADPMWMPLVMTPSFPEYAAAHSTFSAAAAGVLAGFFGTDQMVFGASEYMSPMMRRYFSSFSEAAVEAGTERVWAGVHFSYGNEQGLALGFSVGQYVVSNLFRPSDCPLDIDGIDTDGDGNVSNDYTCVHLAAGDGFIKMADGRDVYVFGFSDATGLTEAEAMMMNMVYAGAPAPTMIFKEGQRVFVKLTNVGMMMRPDLFDPHTVHFHGFPNAAPIFDGEPMASVAVNMGSTFTYYYEPVEPGTFMYHCHVEASEHMQMGMLGMLWVLPKQNNLPDGTILGSFMHHDGYKYAYNDGDGSTYYDKELPLQITGMDSTFHDAELAIQPLPLADMHDDYFLLNGRGYADTVNTNVLINQNGAPSQHVDAKLTAHAGDKVLLRISSLATVDFTTLSSSLPMKVIARSARLLRGPTGKNLYYKTMSVTLGGGESFDAIIDTAGVAPGTYFIYSSNLNQLNNGAEEYGGIMTEIEIQ